MKTKFKFIFVVINLAVIFVSFFIMLFLMSFALDIGGGKIDEDSIPQKNEDIKSNGSIKYYESSYYFYEEIKGSQDKNIVKFSHNKNTNLHSNNAKYDVSKQIFLSRNNVNAWSHIDSNKLGIAFDAGTNSKHSFIENKDTTAINDYSYVSYGTDWSNALSSQIKIGIGTDFELNRDFKYSNLKLYIPKTVVLEKGETIFNMPKNSMVFAPFNTSSEYSRNCFYDQTTLKRQYDLLLEYSPVKNSLNNFYSYPLNKSVNDNIISTPNVSIFHRYVVNYKNEKNSNTYIQKYTNYMFLDSIEGKFKNAHLFSLNKFFDISDGENDFTINKTPYYDSVNANFKNFIDNVNIKIELKDDTTNFYYTFPLSRLEDELKIKKYKNTKIIKFLSSEYSDQKTYIQADAITY